MRRCNKLTDKSLRTLLLRCVGMETLSPQWHAHAIGNLLHVALLVLPASFYLALLFSVHIAFQTGAFRLLQAS